MKKRYVLFNPYSHNGDGEKIVKESEVAKIENAIYVDVTKVSNYEIFFKEINSEDDIIICGGDGTLNHFINNTRNLVLTNDIYFCPAGSGNDFYRDTQGEVEHKIVKINEYLKDLPVVYVNNKEYIFINGVGYGIDGYCCEEGDRLRETTDKPINYTAIAIKGLLFKYKKTNAKVFVDGVCHEFKNVWLAPTMKGRTYGGGMIATPAQDRNSGLLSVMVFTGKTKLGTLMIFPSIFKGEHIKKTKNVTVLTGKEIKVVFDSPRPLQVDGETISGVTEYTARI